MNQSKFYTDASYLTFILNETISQKTGDDYPVCYIFYRLLVAGCSLAQKSAASM